MNFTFLDMKSKINKFIFSFFALQLLIGVACNSFEPKLEISPLPQQDTKFSQEQPRNWEVIEGKVFENPISEWDLSKVSVGKNNKISAIHFIDENLGWVCNKSFVFKTIDAGKTWESFPIDFVGKAKIGSIHFTDALHGWLILQENDDSKWSTEDQIRIYRTIDGGKTWTFSHTEKPALLRDAYFSDNDGWIVATRFLGYGPQRLVPLVIYFSSESSEWIDVSEPVKEVSHDPWYSEDSFPQLGGIAALNNNCVVVVNKSEMIFQSCDKGKSWKFIKDIGNTHSLDSYWMGQIEVEEDFMWTRQSTGGVEGTSTLITVMPNNPSEKMKILNLAYYISSQGYSISKQEFFLVGEKFDIRADNSADKGLILHTTDGGKTWNKILRITEEIKFAQFLPSSLRNIWVLTSNGKLHKLTKEVAKRPEKVV